MSDQSGGPDGGGQDLHQLNLNLHPNEASGLLALENRRILDDHDWEFAFWAVLDEGEVEDCVAVIEHQRNAGIDEGWEIDRLHAETSFVGKSGKTDDTEAVARHDGWVYLFGSHFGSKDGPLQPKRGFIGRFREDSVERTTDDPVVEIEIYRESFVLHRLINDALQKDGPALMPPGGQSCEAFITQTRHRGVEKGKNWDGLVHEDDYPINIEGAAFRDDGSLLLGLRFPVSESGRPVIVGLSGVERLFTAGDRPGEPPEVTGFWVVDAVGREGTIAGVRDLEIVGDELHLVTGNIDSKQKGSVVLEDHPGGRDTVATHFVCKLPEPGSPGLLEAEFVREFPDLPRVEGIASTEDGNFFYVTDEDEGVHLRLTRLLGS